MDLSACHIIYVDRRARQDRELLRPTSPTPPPAASGVWNVAGDECEHVVANVEMLLSAFNNVSICVSGPSCIAKITQLNESIDSDLTPTLVLIDLTPRPNSPPQALPDERPPSPTSIRHFPALPDDESYYGLKLLQRISSEIQFQNYSKLFVPIAFITTSPIPPATSSGPPAMGSAPQEQAGSSTAALDTARMMHCLDAGAVDVVKSPFSKDRISDVAVHAYRAHKKVSREQKAFLAVKKGRKRSWVGFDEEKPYSYLRESMLVVFSSRPLFSPASLTKTRTL
ncbi:MAG: 3',5'-cyclic-nucleotide phosphodiesterase [Trizodia sp. TS-e1964]|nr:MAG: 3',5'-cyclic-nucleotide phosphodiesterase [Trizodia sp. TS-e1964]